MTTEQATVTDGGGDSADSAGGVPAGVTSLEGVRVVTALPTAEVLKKLDHAARRGRLPGFQEGPSGKAGALFTVSAFGTPFDGELRAIAEAKGGETSLRFESALVKKMPVMFLIMCVIAVWPGVWLTDSMLKTYLSWYQYQTWMWYLPLTVVPLPWTWIRAMKKSKAEIARSTLEQLNAIARETGGRVEGLEKA